MAGEAARNKLYNQLIEVLGADSAEELMSHLPPRPVADLATKGDLAVSTKELRTEVATVKADLAAVKVDLAAVKADVAAVKADVAALKADVAAVKSDVAAINLRFDTVNQRIDKIFITQMVSLVTIVAAILASNAIF